MTMISGKFNVSARGVRLLLSFLAVALLMPSMPFGVVGVGITQARAQNRTSFAGKFRAVDYAYGIAPGIAGLQIAPGGGNTATGAQTVTLLSGCTTAGDGTTVCPLNTNTPILVGGGSNQETVTPSAVSSNCLINQGGNFQALPCTFTATFANTHGTGDPIASSSVGLQEAINLAAAANIGATVINASGGTVLVDRSWALAGGTNTKITAAAGFYNVVLEDTRLGDTFWSLQPSTLTSLAVPATLTGTTATFTGTTGTWTNAAQFTCVTYIDALGGEGPCSATFNQTPSANTILTVTSPAASTGAVGYRVYAGASYNGAFLLPVTSTTCTLTSLEGVMPACAIGSSYVQPAIFVNTTTLRPNGQTPTVNLATPMPQGHTTFAYAPAGISLPQVFQTHYGPFPQYGSLTAGQVAYLGSVNLPTGFLNTIGRTIRLSGKLALTTVNTATLPTITVSIDWVAGTTAGVGVTTCSFTPVAAGTSASFNGEFVCTLTTNATGATAIGTLMPGGQNLLQIQTAAANGLGPLVDTNTAAVGSLGLFAQNTLNVIYTSTTNATANEQLLDLHVEVLQ